MEGDTYQPSQTPSEIAASICVDPACDNTKVTMSGSEASFLQIVLFVALLVAVASAVVSLAGAGGK